MLVVAAAASFMYLLFSLLFSIETIQLLAVLSLTRNFVLYYLVDLVLLVTFSPTD